MENYVLIVLVALFLGVMGIIAMLERRRRTELAQFKQLHQTLAVELSQLRAAVETGTKSSSEVTQSSSKELLAEAKRTTKAIQDLQASLEESIKF